MEERLQNFTTFSQARAKVLEDNLKKEGAAKRSNEARKYAKLLAEYGVPSVKDLDEEKRHEFFNALVAEEELETEGNAFGAAVKKAKENGEEEFKLGGKTYKVKEDVENEGNAFGAAVKKAKEEGEDEFEIDGKKYKVEAVTNESFNIEKKTIDTDLILNEAIKVERKRSAKKVVTQLNRLFTKQLPDLQQMGKVGIYGCLKYLLSEAMEDANFHTERAKVVKSIRKASIPGIEVKLPGLGGYHAKIGGSRVQDILFQYVSQISHAADWGGQALVEGFALYISQFHKDDATANAMITAFNSHFEGEEVRVDVAKKTKAINEGRRFVNAVNKAREAGEDTFEFDGKTYKVTKKAEKVNEAEIKDDESFKEYVKSAYSKAFGDDYDEGKAMKAAEGMLKKANGDYGAAVGMVQASLG